MMTTILFIQRIHRAYEITDGSSTNALMRYLQKIFLIICTIAVLPVTINPCTVFAFQNGEWTDVAGYAERNAYYIDRGEICEQLVRLYTYTTSETPVPAVNTFEDLDEAQYPFVLKANALGFVTGMNELIFNPNGKVSRGDLAVMLLRAVRKIYPDANTGGAGDIWFPDKTPEWQKEGLQFAFSRGITVGRNYEAIGAYDPLSLAEAMDMIDRTIRAAPDYAITNHSFQAKRAYLTFDDSVSEHTYSIMDTLDKYDAKASFFMNGRPDPDLLRRMRDGGHAVGNHTYSHQYQSLYASSQSFWRDFDQEQEYLSEILGYSPRLMRFPGGSSNTVSYKYGGRSLMKRLVAEARDRGYLNVDWNVDAGDALRRDVPKDMILNNVLQGARDKKSAVILMHHSSGHAATAQALPEIIQGLRDMGFIFLPLSEDSEYPQFLK